MLTELEQEVLKDLGNIYNKICKIINNDELFTDSVIKSDKQEAVYYIHALETMILAQSAAREYPENYRLLGRLI